MESVYYPARFGRIHALRFGKGAELLIALHGFGDQGKIFAGLETALGARYTIIAIDLPFHGRTEWQKENFNQTDLRDLFGQILQLEGKTSFSLMGFSFGARLAQALLPESLRQLKGLFLLSPDGAGTRGLALADRTPIWLRSALWRWLKKPEWLLSCLDIAHKFRLLPGYIHAFLRKNLSNPGRIQRSFGCWLSMESFRIHPKTLAEAWKKACFKTQVYVGAKDPLLDLKTIQLQYENREGVELIFLEETGHQVLGEPLFQHLMG